MVDMNQGINFVGSTNNIAVASGAQRVAVNCGSGSCTGEQPSFSPQLWIEHSLVSSKVLGTGRL